MCLNEHACTEKYVRQIDMPQLNFGDCKAKVLMAISITRHGDHVDRD